MNIYGMEMSGIPEKQGISFSTHGFQAALLGHATDADKYGAEVRRQRRPKSADTLRLARAHYNRRQPADFPTYFIIEPTAVCNRACPFCSINVTNRAGMMKWEHFTKLMDECGNHRPYGLSLYQLGEPFMWHNKKEHDISDMVNYAVRVGGFSVVNLSTNGDVPNLNCVLGSELSDLIVSIDGVTEETYQRNRPMPGGRPSSLANTTERVKNFLTEKTRLKLREPWVRLQIIRKSDTEQEIKPFIEQWIMRPGVDDVFIKNLDTMRPWIPGLVSEEEDAVIAQRVASMPCQHLWAIGSMTVGGVFTACCHDARTELIEKVTLPDGRIVEASIDNCTFEEYWNGRFMHTLRADHCSGEFRKPCADCRERMVWLGK